MTPEFALAGLVVALLLLLLPPAGKVMTAAGLLLMSGGDLGAGTALVLRFGAVLCLLWIVAGPGIRTLKVDEATTLCVRAVRHLAAGIWLMLTMIAIAHGETRTIVNASIGLVLLVLIASLPKRIPFTALRSALVTAIFVFILVSIFYSWVEPEHAIVQDRLRGLTGNANLFAFYCVLLIALAVIRLRFSYWDACTLVVALCGLIESGSRTSALAALFLLVGSALIGGRLARRSLLIGGGGLGLVLLVAPDSLSWLLPTWDRSWSSRDGAVDVARLVADIAPGMGLGFAELPDYVHSTPLYVFSAGGLLGACLLLLVVARMILDFWRISAGHLIFALAALVHSVGESWLVSTTGPMVAMFAMSAAVVSAVPSVRTSASAANEPSIQEATV